MKYKVSLNGKDYLVEVERGEARILDIADTPVVVATSASKIADATESTAPQSSSISASEPAPVAETISDEILVISPMPGSVIEVSVEIGDQVQKNQKLCVIEAMKMENEIVAPKVGTVNRILIETGSKVETSQVLFVLI
ncbi:MAG TPA: acetyl-CoA carboxylase biotin carboxyl carrier protein subunit [Clostridiaceae bacterium]|nr:acetyl-CoA carboxylase biotin carboxyl carrier protein subunit [Clostridiaceae bacterium]